jgi:hypothetical protein
MNSLGTLPQSRTDQLVIQQTADETLVYDLERHKAHCLNRAASAVWSRCDGTTTVSEMAEILERDLGIPADEDVVRLALSQLQKARLLDGPFQMPFVGSIPARRVVIKRMGLVGAAALLLPVITSIVAPTAVAAATCLGPGVGPCSPSGVECCSGSCIAGTCA